MATEPCQEGPQSVAERAESSVIPEERQRLESFDGKWGDEQVLPRTGISFSFSVLPL